MPVYKDEKTNTWYSKFRYKDWTGKTRDKMKRGFTTKRDAQKWENNFKVCLAGNLDMSFGEFVKIYKEERFPRLKESTRVMKENVIATHILPYFETRRINEISSTDIIKWQNELLTAINPNTGRTYAKSYLKTMHNQINAIFNYACRYYKLRENPASIAGGIGSEDEIAMEFWTLDEYLKFSEEMMTEPIAYYAFQILYWLGCREGEMLALTKADFDLEAKILSITKTYQVIKGVPTITSPKTPESKRKVTIPDFLCEELNEFFEKIPHVKKNERIFSGISKSYLHRHIRQGAERAGVKQIRVHDLRHSHVSLLINMGYSAVAIAKRTGHKSIHVTYRYAHLFPSIQTDMAASLDDLKRKKEGMVHVGETVG